MAKKGKPQEPLEHGIKRSKEASVSWMKHSLWFCLVTKNGAVYMFTGSIACGDSPVPILPPSLPLLLLYL